MRKAAPVAPMSDMQEMNRIIECWAMAEKRAKHLCAFETLGLSGGKWRCRKPNQDDVKKAWHKLCLRLHPDKNHNDELATQAMACVNLAKRHLFEVHYGGASERVVFKHEHRAAEAAAAAAEAEAEAAAAAAASETSKVGHDEADSKPEDEPMPPRSDVDSPPATSGKRPTSETPARGESPCAESKRPRATEFVLVS